MKGTHQVTCRECGATGEVEVTKMLRKGRVAKTIDRVPHAETCPYFRRAQPAHLRSRASVRRQEKRANSLVGAHATVASGALGGDGDGRLIHEWRVESKQTKYHFYRLKQATWEKLIEGALTAGEEPVLHIEFRHTADYCAHVVVRLELYQHWFTRGLIDIEPGRQSWNANDLSYRVNYTYQGRPLLVELEPPGVVLTEETFKRLKDADEEADLRLAAGARPHP